MNEQIRRGDFFLCASARQRDFWLGHLAAAGRVNEHTYDADPALSSLITVVPFGVEDEPPRHRAPAMRGVVAGIGAADEIVFWGGGLYNWFDPLTAIRAVDRLRHRRERVRLFFAGARHPNASVGETTMATRARALAGDLGLTGRHVFFHDWIAYDERESFLVEADIGLSSHVDHLETAFSFRTRVLDYLWAGLPTVTTQGDTLAEVIDRGGRGSRCRPRTPTRSRPRSTHARRRRAGAAATAPRPRHSGRRTGGRRCSSRWSTIAPTRCAAPTSAPPTPPVRSHTAATSSPHELVAAAQRAVDLARTRGVGGLSPPPSAGSRTSQSANPAPRRCRNLCRVNLGSGHGYIEGWVNVDSNPDVHADVYMEAFDFVHEHGHEVTELYMGHFLEHLLPASAAALLALVADRLPEGAQVSAVVPDMRAVFVAYDRGEISNSSS